MGVPRQRVRKEGVKVKEIWRKEGEGNDTERTGEGGKDELGEKKKQREGKKGRRKVR